MPGVQSKGLARASMVVRRAADAPNGVPQNAPQGFRAPIELRNPVSDRFRSFAETNLAEFRVDGAEMCVTKTLALCGAGPSLGRAKIKDADEVWACNSALPYLVSRGVHVDVGIGIDQTPGLLREWSDPPDVTYYVATTCDPELIQHLRDHGRRVKFFHNFVGFEGEREHYETWPPGFIAGEGATVVTRVLGLAAWMGFHRVDVYGADCAFGPDDIVHANGASATEAYGAPVIMEGEIDGKVWRSRPDMLMGAVELARRARNSQGLLRLQAGTLPAALLDKDELYLDEVMRRLRPGETPTDLGVSHG